MQYIDLHSHIDTKADLTIVNLYPKNWDNSLPYYYSIGIHPWYIEKSCLSNDFEIINRALVDKNCLALGECGLDKLTNTDFELQKEVFLKQLALAEKHQKPAIIHCVKAFDELILIKKSHPNITMIIHGFSKSNALAKQLQKHGFYLSFGKHILKHPEMLKDLDLTKIFLETDDDAISIETIYAKVSTQLAISLEVLQKQITNNFTKIFKGEFFI